MLTSKRLNQSIDLVRGMAKRTDTDLNDPARARQFRGVVMRCTSCGHHEACAKIQAGAERLAAAPDFCANESFFD